MVLLHASINMGINMEIGAQQPIHLHLTVEVNLEEKLLHQHDVCSSACFAPHQHHAVQNSQCAVPLWPIISL
jgi:hypothetical protein